jgi:hypothetical protein
MLAFAHIPTGTTTDNGFDIDEVNGRFVEPVAPTAIGADIETGRVHLKKWLRLSHDRGPPHIAAAPGFLDSGIS